MMIILNILMTMHLSLHATAECPKIEGSFHCISQGESLVITVEFKKSANKTTYVIDDYPVVADGKSRFYEDENIKNGKLSGTCINNQFRHHLRGFFKNSKDETYGQVDLISNFKLINNSHLEILQSGEYFFKQYGKIPIDNVIKCQLPNS